MPLNVVSNYAANVAHRNLLKTDTEASASLAKLSIGKRVVSARDDAASMAIGSRMNSEVQALKQAVVNAGQANSMLQIADGAMSTVSDILTRMKVLAIQASSGNLAWISHSEYRIRDWARRLWEFDRAGVESAEERSRAPDLGRARAGPGTGQRRYAGAVRRRRRASSRDRRDDTRSETGRPRPWRP